MVVPKRRDRIVVFRLTQDEFSILQEACTQTGARNLSDYTRALLLDKSASPPDDDRIEGRLLNFDRRLGELQAAVRQITQLLKQMESET